MECCEVLVNYTIWPECKISTTTAATRSGCSVRHINHFGMGDLMQHSVSLPNHETDEALDAYLRRCLKDPSVNVTALADRLDLHRSTLYKIVQGGDASAATLTRFGAFSGALPDNASNRRTLDLLRLLADAEAGWARQLDTSQAA